MNICMDAKVADRTYGKEMSEKIQMRLDQISRYSGGYDSVSYWQMSFTIK